MPTPIAVQLYTLRNETAQDLQGTIDRLAAAGYAGVETAGLYGLAPTELRKRIEDAGMRVAGVHVQGRLDNDLPRLLDEQEGLGSPNFIVPLLPPDGFADADGVKRMAAILNDAVDAVEARDMRLGYHNHSFEFTNVIDGTPAYDLFLDELRSEVFLEVDTYWAQVGGVDPAQLVSRLGDRCPLVHVKDGPGVLSEPQVAVGDGTMDIPGVLAAASSAEWHVVELDACATDVFEAVERSCRYLVGAGHSSSRA